MPGRRRRFLLPGTLCSRSERQCRLHALIALSRKTLDEPRDDLRSLLVQFVVVVSHLPHSTGKVSPKIVTGGRNRPAPICDHLERNMATFVIGWRSRFSTIR